MLCTILQDSDLGRSSPLQGGPRWLRRCGSTESSRLASGQPRAFISLLFSSAYRATHSHWPMEPVHLCCAACAMPSFQPTNPLRGSKTVDEYNNGASPRQGFFRRVGCQLGLVFVPLKRCVLHIHWQRLPQAAYGWSPLIFLRL